MILHGTAGGKSPGRDLPVNLKTAQIKDIVMMPGQQRLYPKPYDLWASRFDPTGLPKAWLAAADKVWTIAAQIAYMQYNNTDTEGSDIELIYITNQQVGAVLSSVVPAKYAQKAAELKQAKRDLERIATECRSGIELILDDGAPAEDAQTGSARNGRKRRATDTTLPETPSGKK